MRNLQQALRLCAFSVLTCLALGSASAAKLEQAALAGANEVPPVNTAASGTVSVAIASDGAVSGGVATRGIAGSAAHVHVGGVGMNGPVVIALTKTGDSAWTVPAGSRLNTDQMKAYRAGDLYVNVHSAVHKDGEIRAQLKP